MTKMSTESGKDVGQTCNAACNICLEEFNNTKVLPCLHTFCLGCITEHATKTTQDGNFNCPVCRIPTILPQGGAVKFNDNTLVTTIEENIPTNQESVNICHVCDNGLTLTAKCIECCDFLCESCAAVHCMTKFTKSHHVVILNTDKPIHTASDAKNDDVCSKHGEKIQEFCVTCQDVACKSCVVADHKNHDLSTTDDAYKVCSTSMMNAMVKLNNKIKHHDTIVTNMDTTLHDIPSEKNAMANFIVNKADKAHKIIDRCMTEIVDTLTEQYIAKRKEVENVKYDAESDLSRMLSISDYVKTTMANGNKLSMLSSHKNLLDEIETLISNSVIPGPDIPENISIDDKIAAIVLKAFTGLTLSELALTAPAETKETASQVDTTEIIDDTQSKATQTNGILNIKCPVSNSDAVPRDQTTSGKSIPVIGRSRFSSVGSPALQHSTVSKSQDLTTVTLGTFPLGAITSVMSQSNGVMSYNGFGAITTTSQRDLNSPLSAKPHGHPNGFVDRLTASFTKATTSYVQPLSTSTIEAPSQHNDISEGLLSLHTKLTNGNHELSCKYNDSPVENFNISMIGRPSEPINQKASARVSPIGTPPDNTPIPNTLMSTSYMNANATQRNTSPLDNYQNGLSNMENTNLHIFGHPFGSHNGQSNRSSPIDVIGQPIGSHSNLTSPAVTPISDMTDNVFAQDFLAKTAKKKLVAEFNSRISSDRADSFPTGVAITPDNNIAIIDQENKKVKIFTPSGQIKYVYNGNAPGMFPLQNPCDIGVFSSGNLVVSDSGAESILILSKDAGRVLHSMHIKGCTGVAVSDDDKVFVTTRNPNNILVFKDGVLHQKIHSDAAGIPYFNSPHYITARNKKVYASDFFTNALMGFNLSNSLPVVHYGSTQEGVPASCILQYPCGVHIDQEENVHIVDKSNHRVHKISKTGEFLGHTLTSNDGIYWPRGIALMSNGNTVITEDFGQIKIFDC
ncbi:unnamed protein product [Owenia fusiformis]|uniref:Uncharacterized protein n=1 Tax=Owenia fusiformis TaxID=6347 RepID=A0A8S4NTR8_OWEFU|nr:unnamed protein product [Owenia fusiformis]